MPKKEGPNKLPEQLEAAQAALRKRVNDKNLDIVDYCMRQCNENGISMTDLSADLGIERRALTYLLRKVGVEYRHMLVQTRKVLVV